MVPCVKSVQACDDYVISVEFDNGEAGWLDMKPMLDFGIFNRIKDINAFQKVQVSFDTVEWECGVDLDPEFVYSKCMNHRSEPRRGIKPGVSACAWKH